MDVSGAKRRLKWPLEVDQRFASARRSDLASVCENINPVALAFLFLLNLASQASHTQTDSFIC